MEAVLRCPRCGREVAEPTVTENNFRCAVHGAVAALFPPLPSDPGVFSELASVTEVPLWFPTPLPTRWLATGVRSARTPRRRAVAVACGLSGQGLAAGPSDVVVVAEQPGVGLGSWFAGLSSPDPGAELLQAPAEAKIHTGHRTTSLWSVPTPPDRVAFVGEADGNWLWIIGWPQTAWSLVADDLRLADARLHEGYRALPLGALNPRLSKP